MLRGEDVLHRGGWHSLVSKRETKIFIPRPELYLKRYEYSDNLPVGPTIIRSRELEALEINSDMDTY